MNTANENRIGYIDVASALMLLYMINVHLSDWNWCTKGTWIECMFYSLFPFPFMSWFFFKAGMFHKDKPIKQIVKTGYFRLIVPFFVFGFVGHVFHCVRLYVEFNDTNIFHYVLYPFASILKNGAPHGNFALWFLLSLYAVKLVYSYVRVRCKIFLIIVACLLLFCILDGARNSYGDIIPVYLFNISLGCIFYTFGYLLRYLQYKRYVVYLGVCVFFCSYLPIAPFCNFRTGEHTGSLLLYIILAISFCVVLNNFCKILPWRLSLLRNIGRNAMIWYVLHWPLLIVSRLVFFSGVGIQEGWLLRIIQLCVIIITCYFLTPFLKRKFPSFVGVN